MASTNILPLDVRIISSIEKLTKILQQVSSEWIASKSSAFANIAQILCFLDQLKKFFVGEARNMTPKMQLVKLIFFIQKFKDFKNIGSCVKARSKEKKEEFKLLAKEAERSYVKILKNVLIYANQITTTLKSELDKKSSFSSS
jgi:hypothetical protein